MKFICLNGREINISVRPSKNPIGKIHRSKLQTLVGQKLIERYPYEQICQDWVLPKSHLSLDFFIPRLIIAIEVNPIESAHTKHNSFFHGQITEGKFARQKRNDTEKARFCELNNIKLIEIFTEQDLNLL